MNALHWLWIAVAIQVIVSLHNIWRSHRTFREWRKLRQLNQLNWAYSKELIEKGVTLPPRCVMCCQILPRHVDGCLMGSEHDKRETGRPVIKYYPKGEHAPHPVEEEPPPHA